MITCCASSERRRHCSFRIDADSDAWQQVEEAIQKFWSPELEWLWPPTVPGKWRKFPSRQPIVSIARHTGLVPGAEVLLASVSAPQPPFALSVSYEGGPLAVSLLGPLGLGGSGVSERWLCELRPGAPLPRLAEVYPGAAETGYQPLPDAPKERDRVVAEGELHGLLVSRRGEAGRELYEVHRCGAELVRECRFTPGPAEQVAALSPEDPTVWTVEWAVNGNSNYLAGPPSSFFCMFGRSLPPEPGAARAYELLMHGLSDPAALEWLRLLAEVGLSVRERQPTPPRLSSVATCVLARPPFRSLLLRSFLPLLRDIPPIQGSCKAEGPTANPTRTPRSGTASFCSPSDWPTTSEIGQPGGL